MTDIKGDLFYAVDFAYVKDLKKILANPKININAFDHIGYTVLHSIFTSGYDGTFGKNQRTCLDLLLKHPKIDVNKRNKDGDTPLYFAVNKVHIQSMSGRIACVKALLKSDKLDINAKNKGQFSEGETALHLAVRECDIPLVKLLLADPRINVMTKNGRGYTARTQLLPDEKNYNPQTLYPEDYYKNQKEWDEIIGLLKKKEPIEEKKPEEKPKKQEKEEEEEYTTYKGKEYTVYTGTRGGKYIMVNDKKSI